MARIKPKMTVAGMVLAVLALIIVLGVNSLAYFKVIDLTSTVLGILTIIGSLFVLVEVEVLKKLKNITKTNTLSIIGMIVALITLIGGVSSVMSYALPTVISGSLGITNALLVIFIIIEAFR